MHFKVMRGKLNSMISLANIIKRILVIFLLIIFTGCANPGYSVRIHVDKNANATEKDIQLITGFLNSKNYDVVMIKEQKNWKVESYKINLDKRKFKHVDHKYINFVVEYTYDKNAASHQMTLEQINIRIGNVWDGRDPALKKEIDLVADDVIQRLKQNFNVNAFSSERLFVAPI
jgi:uncharacterized OsmC-like protein